MFDNSIRELITNSTVKFSLEFPSLLEGLPIRPILVFELEFFPNRTAPYNLDSSMSLPLKHVVFLPSTRFYTCHRNLPLLRSRSGLLNSTNRHVPCRIGMEETSYTPHIWPREDRSSRLQDSEPHPT